jgi:hypothetical protein
MHDALVFVSSRRDFRAVPQPDAEIRKFESGHLALYYARASLDQYRRQWKYSVTRQRARKVMSSSKLAASAQTFLIRVEYSPVQSLRLTTPIAFLSAVFLLKSGVRQADMRESFEMTNCRLIVKEMDMGVVGIKGCHSSALNQVLYFLRQLSPENISSKF